MIHIHSKIKINKNLKTNEEIKSYLLKEYKKCNWNKPNCKLHYNNLIVNRKLNFNVSYFLDNGKAFLEIEDIKIPIRLQDYFHFVLVKELKKNKITSDWFYDDYLIENIFSIEDTHSINNKIKSYRTDMMINLCDNKYLCIEFFENHHKNFDDHDLIREKNRIYNLVFSNENCSKEIVHFAIFWQKNLCDDKELKKFAKHIIKKIKDYTNIDNKRIWCIDSINKFIHNQELSENLYDAFQDKNSPTLDIKIINNLVEWKNEKYKKKYFDEFTNFISKLNEINNISIDIFDNIDCDFDEKTQSEKKIYYEKDKLTYNGFFHYLNNIKIEYLENIQIKIRINELFNNITTGFISGTEERFELLTHLKKELIYGLFS
jgi:hypothetical protein